MPAKVFCDDSLGSMVAECASNYTLAIDSKHERDNAAFIANAPADLEWALSQLDSVRAANVKLTAAVRWALGEEGGFVPAPDILIDRLHAGKHALALKGQYPFATPSRLYWWRGELRERAGLSEPSVAGSPHTK